MHTVLIFQTQGSKVIYSKEVMYKAINLPKPVYSFFVFHFAKFLLSIMAEEGFMIVLIIMLAVFGVMPILLSPGHRMP